MLTKHFLVILISLISFELLAQSGFLLQDSVTVEIQGDCELGASVCLDGITPNEAASYTITVDGTPYSNATDACAFATVGVYNFAGFLQLAPAGPYQVTSWDLNGTDNTGNFATFEELAGLLNTWDPAGNWYLQFPLIIGGQQGIEYDTLFVKSVLFNTEGALGYSTGFLPNGSAITVSVGVHTIIATNTITLESDTLTANVTCSNIQIISEIMYVGDSLNACADIADLGGLPVSAINYCADNGNPVAQFGLPDAAGCVGFVGIEPGVDTACIIVCDNLGFCDTTLIVVTVVPQPLGQIYYLYDTLEVGSITTICDPVWTNDSTSNACDDAQNGNVAFALSINGDCLNVTANIVGQDTACIISCPSGISNCDTTYVIITVVAPPPTLAMYYTDTIYLNGLSGGQYCYFDPFAGAINLCPTISGDVVSFSTLPEACVSYIPMNLGIDTACYLICGEEFCDTVYMYITVLLAPSPDTASVVLQEGETIIFCASTDELGTNLTSIVFSPDVSNNADMNQGNPANCLEVVGLAYGTDTVLIVITNNDGLSDTTLLFVFVTPATTTAFVVDTLGLGGTNIYCLDLSELPGELETIDYPCGIPNSNIFTYVLDQNNFCMQLTGGDVIGTDSFCVVLCDNNGACDTTFFIMTTEDVATSPIVVNDFYGTTIDSTIFVVVGVNDLNINQTTTVTILGNGPQNGILTELSPGIYEYNPNELFCGQDSFSYASCNETFCDTALVVIEVSCPDTVIIFNAISPNGDDKNDTWIIIGLNNIPNNEVTIYNRWGNLVYETTDYQNDWAGTYEGNDLPDSSYFYVLRDLDSTKIYSGWIQIFR
jgi:gliding motility-associated-like protein